MRILVCWDDPAQLELLTLYLSVHGNTVEGTVSVDALLQSAESSLAFDVVLMSATLPDFDAGLDTFQRLVHMRPGWPVVAACPQSPAIEAERRGWRGRIHHHAVWRL
jgi:CheY-like chemotaxis protein